MIWAARKAEIRVSVGNWSSLRFAVSTGLTATEPPNIAVRLGKPQMLKDCLVSTRR